MKNKRFLNLFIALVLCLSPFTVFAADELTGEKQKDKMDVFYNDEIINFDVEPVIENGRTLVPLRAIFEAMGCAVYYAEDDGKQIVTARRANDNLQLTIGENKMYFNGEEKALDVPAKITDGRTLVPLRAISEAFECEVHWYGETKKIDIYSPANAYLVSTKKIEEIITDDEGNVLIEAVAYYPVIENSYKIPCFDLINFDYEWDVDKFMEEARAKKEDALNLRKEMGEAFTPFVYELTFEQTYRKWGYLSFTNHKYINVGGVHPTKTMESRTYCTSYTEEFSISDVIDEEMLDVSLNQYVTNLFVNKLKEIAPESADIYTYDYINEYIGYVQFYLTKNSVVLYFNQGELAPYALGVISVEIPYDPQLFNIDMRYSYETEHIFEYEYYNGYEWKIMSYADDKLIVTEENIDYPPEKIYSEYYPVGLHTATIKGIKKGNAAIILAHVKKGEDIETATQIYISSFYVDENNMLTLITEDDGMFLIEQNLNKELDENIVYPMTEDFYINDLDDGKLSVSLEKGGAYLDDDGKPVMDVTVYSYEIYSMVTIASLKENDVIVRKNEEIKVREIERLEGGLVRINGGEENGGFDLVSKDNVVYYEIGMNDVKSYYEEGKVTLPVSEEFEYIDKSDLDTKPKYYSFKDFIADDSVIEYNFTPHNTCIVIKNGAVVKMSKVYMP